MCVFMLVSGNWPINWPGKLFGLPKRYRRALPRIYISLVHASHHVSMYVFLRILGSLASTDRVESSRISIFDGTLLIRQKNYLHVPAFHIERIF